MNGDTVVIGVLVVFAAALVVLYVWVRIALARDERRIREQAREYRRRMDAWEDEIRAHPEKYLHAADRTDAMLRLLRVPLESGGTLPIKPPHEIPPTEDDRDA